MLELRFHLSVCTFCAFFRSIFKWRANLSSLSPQGSALREEVCDSTELLDHTEACLAQKHTHVPTHTHKILGISQPRARVEVGEMVKESEEGGSDTTEQRKGKKKKDL